MLLSLTLLLCATLTLANPIDGTVPAPYVPLKASAEYAWPTFELQRPALRTDDVEFESHSGPHPFQSYLVQTLDFTHVKPFYTALQARLDFPIQSRGEAHITVITPPEFDNVLSKVGITMDDIDRIARRMDIQNVKIEPVCVGKAKKALDGRKQADTVFFIVMNAPELVDIRREIQKLYVRRGGEGALFEAELFWPHVTVGFTYRDMFLEDGVFKGHNSCFGRVVMVNPPRRRVTYESSGGGGGDDQNGGDGSDEDASSNASN